jgi:putative ABC transport system ATP-binding protein
VSEVEFRGVVKSYHAGEVEVPVLRGIDLKVGHGDLLVILGPSGSGKTTLLNLVAGIDRPDEGEVLVAGKDLSGLTDDELTVYRRRYVGYVFQFFNLLPTLTAHENVAVALELLGRPDDKKANEALDSLGLGDKGSRFPYQLSGGEQQRVAIARAIVKSPKVIVADEPTGNLDDETAIEILKVMREMNRDGEATLILATHDTKAKAIADSTVRLRGGKIVSE